MHITHILKINRMMLMGATLAIARLHSLSDKTDIDVSEGAVLELNFKGEVRISKLSFAGKLQPAGTYSAENAPQFIKGKGALLRISVGLTICGLATAVRA